MRFRAIIFDMDGTLVDSVAAYQMAFNKGTAKFGLPPVSVSELARTLNDGLSLEQIIVTVFPERDDPSFLAACREGILEAFRDVTEDDTPLLPGTKETLETLNARGLKLGVATGRTTPSKRVRWWLKSLGIDGLLEAVVTSDDVVARKPAPDCILECARRLGVPAQECLVVGDSTVDIAAAKAAGAGIVAVLTGVAGKEILTAHEPLAILEDLTKLLLFLES